MLPLDLALFRCTTFPLKFPAVALISMTTTKTACDYNPVVRSATGLKQRTVYSV